MEYRGYTVTERDNSVIIDNVRDFNPVHVFECGQCFRWLKQGDGSYTGVAGGRAVNVKYAGGRLVLFNATYRDFTDVWYEYFDLGRDYSKIKAALKKDEIMEKAVEFGYGIRLLKQDIWETLISFIISANNRIPMIMKTVASIAGVYGDTVKFPGNDFHSFPAAEKLRSTALAELEACRGGFRCKYIIEASRMISDGTVDLYSLSGLSAGNAREQLMRLPGVGPKVADCVLLYSGTKYDVFPTDVWVKRVMEELYFRKETSLKEIQRFASEYFGGLAGFAQQYLFYYARENRIGT